MTERTSATIGIAAPLADVTARVALDRALVRDSSAQSWRKAKRTIVDGALSGLKKRVEG